MSKRKNPIKYIDKNNIWLIHKGKDNDGDIDYTPSYNGKGIGIACESLESAYKHIRAYVDAGYTWINSRIIY